jgi:hypothetical protein
MAGTEVRAWPTTRDPGMTDSARRLLERPVTEAEQHFQIGTAAP